VTAHGIQDVLARRHGMPAIAELCDSCNMRYRYGPVELAKVGAALAAIRLRDARSAIGF
jgi:hypothetical protein